MNVDKSAEARSKLTSEITRVERREEEFTDLRNSYQRSLEQFRAEFHAVGRKRESMLHENLQSGRSVAQRDLEARQELLSQVDRYVEESAEELEQTCYKVRLALDDEREKLISEKNALPWE